MTPTVLYVRFSVAIHGLSLDGSYAVEKYRQDLQRLITEHHPSGASNITDSNVEVEVEETAATSSP